MIFFVLGIIRFKIFDIYISVYSLADPLKKIVCSAQRTRKVSDRFRRKALVTLLYRR